MAKKKNKSKASNGMGSIRKRSNGSYEVRYTEKFDATGKQVQRSKSFKTEREANEFRIKTLNQINEGTYVSPSQMSLEEWIKTYLSKHTVRLKDSTKASYEERLRVHVIPALGSIKLCKLSTEMVQDFINDLGRKTKSRNALAPKTIKCVHGVLHKVLNKAVELKYIHNNPANGSTLPKVVAPNIEPLSEGKTIEFLKTIKENKYESIYMIALFMGLRQSEILGLCWDCVNWEKNIITVSRQLTRKRKGKLLEDEFDDDDDTKYKLTSVKNDRVRYLCVDDEMMSIFRARLEEQNEQRKKAGGLWHEPFPNLIFEDEYGKNLVHGTVRKHFKKAVTHIGLPEERFHNMRHNYTVVALENGDDVNTVQKNLGHATPNFTLSVYDHVTESRKIKSAQRMNDRIKNLKESID